MKTLGYFENFCKVLRKNWILSKNWFTWSVKIVGVCNNIAFVNWNRTFIHGSVQNERLQFASCFPACSRKCSKKFSITSKVISSLKNGYFQNKVPYTKDGIKHEDSIGEEGVTLKQDFKNSIGTFWPHVVAEGQTFYPFDYTKCSLVINNINMVQNIVTALTHIIHMRYCGTLFIILFFRYHNLWSIT